MKIKGNLYNTGDYIEVVYDDDKKALTTMTGVILVTCEGPGESDGMIIIMERVDARDFEAALIGNPSAELTTIQISQIQSIKKGE